MMISCLWGSHTSQFSSVLLNRMCWSKKKKEDISANKEHKILSIFFLKNFPEPWIFSHLWDLYVTALQPAGDAGANATETVNARSMLQVWAPCWAENPTFSPRFTTIWTVLFPFTSPRRSLYPWSLQPLPHPFIFLSVPTANAPPSERACALMALMSRTAGTCASCLLKAQWFVLLMGATLWGSRYKQLCKWASSHFLLWVIIQ